MKRYGWIIGVKEEKIDEYKKLHANVWLDVLDVGEDFDGDMAKMAADPTTQKWWKVCKPCQEPLPDRDEDQWWADMEEVFHCD